MGCPVPGALLCWGAPSHGPALPGTTRARPSEDAHPRARPPRSTVTPPWRSRLLAWPGVLTLLSVLAVLLGHHPPMPDQGPRATAGTVAPALPELRPAPQPTPRPP